MCPVIFLFPHMELRLMFHTLWTNSSCHGYHSLEFPISWVIKFPSLIFLYWFIYVTPYFLGLLSLGEQSRTLHRLLVSSQAFAFCAPVLGKIETVFFPQGVSSSRKYTGMTPRTPEATWALGLCSGCPGFLKPLLLLTMQARSAARTSGFMALALDCFFPPCCLHAVWVLRLSSLQEIRRTTLSVLLPGSLMLIIARASGQPACWDSQGEPREESDGVWELLSQVLQ